MPVTYTLTPFTVRDATKLNQNFADVLAAIPGPSVGTGSLVRATSPTIATPTLTGTTTAGAINSSGSVTCTGLSTGDETMTYDEGSFTVTVTDYGSLSVDGTAYYVRYGKAVTLHLPTMKGIAGFFSSVYLDGIPEDLQVARSQFVGASLHHQSNIPFWGTIFVEPGAAWALYRQNSFDSVEGDGANQCGVNRCTINYLLI